MTSAHSFTISAVYSRVQLVATSINFDAISFDFLLFIAWIEVHLATLPDVS